MALEGPVIVAYDGSPAADHAIRSVGALFAPAGATAVVVHVFEAPPSLPPPPPGIPIPAVFEVDVKEVEGHARAVAEHGAAVATEAGLKATAKIAHGTGPSGAWSEIVRIADEEGAALIVVGSRGHSGLRAALLGSVSDGVVHHAGRPVLVVPRSD